MKKILFFVSGVVFGAVFLGNGFYTMTSSEHKAYILNKYTRTVYVATPSRIEKVDYRK
jgi:hypothetical protein